MEESLASICEKNCSFSLYNLTLNEQDKEVVVYISGYIDLEVCSTIGECYSRLLFGESNNSEYLQTLSRADSSHHHKYYVITFVNSLQCWMHPI